VFDAHSDGTFKHSYHIVAIDSAGPARTLLFDGIKAFDPLICESIIRFTGEHFYRVHSCQLDFILEGVELQAAFCSQDFAVQSSGILHLGA